MSGPKTSRYNLRAVRLQEQARIQAEERKRREEFAARVTAAKEKCSLLEKRAARFAHAVREIRERFPSEKVDVAAPNFRAPQSEDPNLLEKFVAKLERDLTQSESALRNAGEQAKANQNFLSATQGAAELCEGTTMSAAEVMQRFVVSNAAKVSENLLKDRRAELDRILGRHGSENWSDAPPKLEQLVMAAMAADSKARFGALATEIRFQIQELKKAEETRKVDSGKAKLLLERLEQDVPVGEELLKQRLELVRVGAIPFSEEFETRTHDALAKARDTNRARIQETATGIVKDALTDLGYDVAPIQETLFARGGKVYFRKAGWNNYCVRLTVRPDESKMNFNVVRIALQGDESEAASRAADIEAENAWCSGYQQLVDTLKTRGLETELTRHLPVGAVPVPKAGADEISLSAFGSSDKKRKATKKSKNRGGESK